MCIINMAQNSNFFYNFFIKQRQKKIGKKKQKKTLNVGEERVKRGKYVIMPRSIIFYKTYLKKKLMKLIKNEGSESECQSVNLTCL